MIKFIQSSIYKWRVAVEILGYSMNSISYIQQGKMQSQQRRVNSLKIFKIPTASQLREVEYLQHVLEAFCFESTQPQKKKKLVLIPPYLSIFEPTEDQQQPSLITEISDQFRFQRLLKTVEASETAQISGFTFMSEKGKKVTFEFQFKNEAEIWVSYLSKIMVEVGFHHLYQVVNRIGNGSTATISLVRRLKDGQLFAAKVFPKAVLSDPKKKEGLYNQIQLLRVLDHPNTLKCVNVMESESSIYLISELMTGGNILERINACQGLSLSKIKQILKGVLKGLAYLHKFGIMHRDIKLENIMFRSMDSWDPVIIDFGLAAMTDNQPYLYYRCGTPGYIAPEIITMQGKKHLGVGCDIFSAGCLLHVLLTNAYLYNGSSSEVYEKNKASEFDLSSSKYSRVDKQGMDLLSAMLELSPSNRAKASECLEHEFLNQPEGHQKDNWSTQMTEVSFVYIYPF